jgi:Ca2+-binding RTX toxin-like protein
MEADTLTGGSGNDILWGHGLGDTLKGGPGSDTYAYLGSLDSTGLAYDTIVGFDANTEKFDFIQRVTAVNATIHGGSLTTANFDGDIGTAVNGHLGAYHAILFEPTSGDFAGSIFLIVDGNGIAGYNGSDDFAILLKSPSHLANLDATNFI